MNLRFLFSYHYFAKTLETAWFENILKYKPDMILDSGAFTAFTKGVEIAIDKYADCLKRHGKHFKFYFNLDVIGNPKKSEDNLKYLQDQGLSPVPVFQRGDTLGNLYAMLERYPRVAIGGVAGTNDVIPYLKYFVDRPDIDSRKLHLLGISSAANISYFRPGTCDSSSWTAGMRYGRMTIFKLGKEVSCSFNQYLKSQAMQAYILRNAPDIYSHSFDKAWWRNVVKDRYQCVLPRMAVVYAKAVSEWFDLKYGTELYLAGTDSSQYTFVLDIFNKGLV